ncbi:hypothetical protein BDW22DRAFT_838763 [Trametopsis cervina]|nr:hypothetical protein BDW22DRAFT_838763 [Trametopsis cervina]
MVDQVALVRVMQSVEGGRSRLAALCFLLWDICITTDQEVRPCPLLSRLTLKNKFLLNGIGQVEHIWQTPFQPLKLLYLFTRYYSVLVLIILNSHVLTCHGWIVVEAVSAVLLEAAVEILLMLRIYAMYTASKLTLKALVPAFAAQIIIMSISLAVSLPRVMTTEHCVEAAFPTTIIAYSMSSILFEALLFAMVMYKYLTASKGGWLRTSILQVLVRDNLWTFLLIFLADFANAIFFTVAPASLSGLGFPFLLAIFGAVGPRLVLNVREVHARQISRGQSASDFSSISLVHRYVPTSTDDPDDRSPRTPGSGKSAYADDFDVSLYNYRGSLSPLGPSK